MQLAVHKLKEIQENQSIDEMDEKDLEVHRLYQKYKLQRIEGDDNIGVGMKLLDGQDLRDLIGVTASYHAKMILSQDKKGTSTPEIAVIAFWKMNEEDEFKCYRHFTIPNPMKREIKRNDTTDASLAQVLYQTDNGEVYFFFKEPIKDGDKGNYNSPLRKEKKVHFSE